MRGTISKRRFLSLRSVNQPSTSGTSPSKQPMSASAHGAVPQRRLDIVLIMHSDASLSNVFYDVRTLQKAAAHNLQDRIQSDVPTRSLVALPRSFRHRGMHSDSPIGSHHRMLITFENSLAASATADAIRLSKSRPKTINSTGWRRVFPSAASSSGFNQRA